MNLAADFPADSRGPVIRYSPALERAIALLTEAIQSQPGLARPGAERWLAIKLLERDTDILDNLQANPTYHPVRDRALHLSKSLLVETGEDSEVLIADERYSWINELTREVVEKIDVGPSATERIDKIVTNRWLGLPIFLMVMYVLFRFTSEIPAAYVSWLHEVISGPLTHWISVTLSWLGLGGSWFESLIVQGVLPGVGSVLAFIPVLAALYLGLGLLEESGYMARAAFVVDRFMHMLGLHGKSFLPMIVGFGCSVPGIYATRTMDNQRERLLTGLLVPFMSCSARLPVYLLLTAVFFPHQAGMVIFGLYLFGIVTAVLVGLVLNRIVFRGMPQATSIIELPVYHKLVWKNIFRQTRDRTSGFLHKAGTIILTCSVFVWLLMSIPIQGKGRFAEAALPDSLFATLSQAVTPVFAPLGFGNWQSSGALASGIVAKEVIVSTLAQSYNGRLQPVEISHQSLPADLMQIVNGFFQAGVSAFHSLFRLVGINLAEPTVKNGPEASLSVSIQKGFDATSCGHPMLAALAFLVFVLLYTPCISTLTAARHELGNKWMALTAIGQFGVAWVIALLVYNLGLLLIKG